MHTKKWYLSWAALYFICAGLGCIPEPSGVLAGFMVVLSLLFFVPPAALLYWAIPREKWAAVRLIRYLSLGSLTLTLVLLVLNFLSAGLSDTAGTVLYALLVLVSSPMVCGQAWVISLFLWACILMVTLKYRKKT